MTKQKKPSPPGKAFLRKALLNWYDQNKRELPWRKTSDPYKILVSEMMLQQTQVATVIPYYTRFLKLFPNAKKLAAASEQKVLKAWEGLGYYRRARFLHAAAMQVADKGFPQDREGILELPGVGTYTAAAVGSIALGNKDAVVDGNVIRVLTRLFALEGDPLKENLKSDIIYLANAILEPERPGDFNQALMELGAMVCTPQGPDCYVCPWLKRCQAYKQNRESDFPQLAPRPVTKKVIKIAVLLSNKGRFLMAERKGSGRSGDQGRMRGLWQFPEKILKSDKNIGKAAWKLASTMQKGDIQVLADLEPIVHQVTNNRITVYGFVFEVEAEKSDAWTWKSLGQLKKLPLAKAERLLLKEAQVL